MTIREGAGSSLGGYRLVRRLAAGSRADIYLGSGQTGVAAIKVFHPDVTAESIGRELDALGRLDSPHLVRLRDVATGPGERPILILDRVRNGSVSALLRERDSLEGGEVVTLVAPLAAAMAPMHRAGVAHGRIGPASLHIGAGGEPVLLGFGAAALFAAGGSIAAIDAQPSAARDRSGLAALAVALLSRVRDAATDRRVVELIEWIDAAPLEYEFPERLEVRLFDFSDPVPVELGRMPVAPESLPTRMGIISSGTGTGTGTPRNGAAAPPEPAPDGNVRRIDRLEALLRENPLVTLKARGLQLARGVRKPFWVVGAAVALALIVAVSVIPQGSSPATVIASAPPETSVTTASQPALPDDPVAALPLLLAQRTRCFRDLSVLCLDGVDDQSTSAYESDVALVQQLQGGTETSAAAVFTADHPRLVESLGASAIVSLGTAAGAAVSTAKSTPASVLMIRTEAGWRIRGYLSGVAATGSPTSN